jgi:hypothetical protein
VPKQEIDSGSGKALPWVLHELRSGLSHGLILARQEFAGGFTADNPRAGLAR